MEESESPEALEALGGGETPMDSTSILERPAYKHHGHTQKAFEVLNVLRR